VLIVALVVGALVAGVLAERGTDPTPSGDDLPLAAEEAMAVAAPTDALVSVWHCAVGTAAAGGIAPLTLVVANTTAELRSGSVRWVPDQGDAVAQPLGVGPGAVVRLAASDAVGAAWVAATVELDGGGVVVEQQVRGPGGLEVAPCASAGSAEWHLAHGATTRDAVEILTLYNPFAEDAIVDVRVTTDEGRVDPPDLVGVVVESGTLQVIDLGTHVRRQPSVATTVAARTGRLVVDRVQAFDGTEGRRGLGIGPAVPAAGTEWWFPQGLWSAGTSERFHVYNPGTADAVATIDLTLDGGAPVEPVELTVGPRSVVAFDVGADGRVPAGVGYAAVVRSANGVPVVVEREQSTPTTPSPGWASTPGARRPASRWALAYGESSSAVEQWVAIQNPGAEATTVTLRTLGPAGEQDVPGLGDLAVPAGGRLVVALADHLEGPSLPLVATARAPVVVERVLWLEAGVGGGLAIGVPLSD
jgi:hypothetical protein